MTQTVIISFRGVTKEFENTRKLTLNQMITSIQKSPGSMLVSQAHAKRTKAERTAIAKYAASFPRNRKPRKQQ
jgi:uncharacterized FlgJ-related protein